MSHNRRKAEEARRKTWKYRNRILARIEGKLGQLSGKEIGVLKKAFPDGMKMLEIIQVIKSRGYSFSEPSFRKYTQLGFIPQSRRVGKKGKHRGSYGLYPACSIELVIFVLDSTRGTSITLEDLQIPSFRARVLDEQTSRGYKEVLQGLDDQTQREQEKGEKISKKVLASKSNLKQTLRAVIRAIEANSVAAKEHANNVLEAKTRSSL